MRSSITTWGLRPLTMLMHVLKSRALHQTNNRSTIWEPKLGGKQNKGGNKYVNDIEDTKQAAAPGTIEDKITLVTFIRSVQRTYELRPCNTTLATTY